MKKTNDPSSILICGGGIAGLSLAILLKQKGFSPLVIEKQKIIPSIPKGEFFQPEGVEKLQSLGVLENLLKKPSAIRIDKLSHHYLWLHQRKHFEFSYKECDITPAFGLSILHEELLDVLREKFESMGGDFLPGVYLKKIDSKKNHIVSTLSNNDIVKTNFFIGADGRFSTTRRMLGKFPRNLPCDHIILGAFIREKTESFFLKNNEFYTETTKKGVLYAFRYPDARVRVYLCFKASEIPFIQKNKENYLFELLRHSQMIGSRPFRIEGATWMMPTVDSILDQPYHNRCIWIGDASGTVDPLSGHGMSLSLSDSFFVGDFFENLSSIPKNKISKTIEGLGKKIKKNHLHGRFVGSWLGVLFLTNSLIIQSIKNIAFTRYQSDLSLKKHLIGLFSGKNRENIALYDLPYLLGLLPTSLRTRLHQNFLAQKSLDLQNLIATYPIALRPKLYSKNITNWIKEKKAKLHFRSNLRSIEEVDINKKGLDNNQDL